MARSSSIITIHIAIVSLLLISEPAHILVEGQLEAVGAVLSVVPVTSILATAGLVGVKLAALSRLLDMMGYDRAYLAQGGSGTAAHPIGLQTKYAYMFPYVPGLNISVRGEDSFGVQDSKVEAVAPQRKTYPAMGLPADYEHQQRPFRGSETLQTVLKQAGVHVHSPTIQQQQQLQQQFNLPPEGNERRPQAQVQQQFRPQQAQLSNPTFIGFDDSNPNLQPKNHIVIQPTYKEPIHIDQQTNNNIITNNNNVTDNNNHIINNNQNQNAHSSSFQSDSHQLQSQSPRPTHSIPSNLTPHHPGDIVHSSHADSPIPTHADSNRAPQPVDAPSSSSSQQTASIQAPSENSNNNNRVQPVDTAIQVNNDPYHATMHTHPTYHTAPTSKPSPQPSLSPTPFPVSSESSISAFPWSPPTATSSSPSTPPQPTQTSASWMPWLPSISASVWSPPTQYPPTTPTPLQPPTSSPSSSSSSWLPASISASVWSPPSSSSPSSSSPSSQSASWLPSTISAAIWSPSMTASTASTPSLATTPMQNIFPPQSEISRPSLSGAYYGTHAAIPQRNEFIKQLMELRRQRQQEQLRAKAAGLDKSVHIGPLSRPPNGQSIIEPNLATLAPSPQPVSAIELVPLPSSAGLPHVQLQLQPQAQTQTQNQNKRHPNSPVPAESRARIPQNNLNRISQHQQLDASPQPPQRPSSAIPNSLRPPPGETGDGANRGPRLQQHQQQQRQHEASQSPPHRPQSAVPNSLRPQQGVIGGGDNLGSWPHQQNSGFTGAPHETTTNFVPRPFDLGDFPSTSPDDFYNEIDRMQQNRRRRKRSAHAPIAVTFSRPAAGLSSQLESKQPAGAPQPDNRSALDVAPKQPLQTESTNQQESLTPPTFGMPALNIHSLRRRRRHSRFTGPGNLGEKLRNRSG